MSRCLWTAKQRNAVTITALWCNDYNHLIPLYLLGLLVIAGTLRNDKFTVKDSKLSIIKVKTSTGTTTMQKR